MKFVLPKKVGLFFLTKTEFFVMGQVTMMCVMPVWFLNAL